MVLPPFLPLSALVEPPAFGVFADEPFAPLPPPVDVELGTGGVTTGTGTEAIGVESEIGGVATGGLAVGVGAATGGLVGAGTVARLEHPHAC